MNRISLGIFLCLVLLLSITIPTYGQSEKIDRVGKTLSISDNGDVYFFAFAFVIGKYDNYYKQFGYFQIWNPDYTKKTMYVLGYAPYLPEKLIFVKACHIQGSFRIGFIGNHHCLIFIYGPGIAVST